MGKYTVNDFFCGAGGVGLGFINAGFDVIYACDFDKYCVKTYSHNVGGWVKQADVTKLKYNDIPKADGWAFGFPCQDLSIAGKRAGFAFKCNDCETEWTYEKDEKEEGDICCPKCGSKNFSAKTRSACFFEMMRLLDETKANAPENYPKFLLAENVKGLKPYIPVLTEELKKRGFDVHIQLYNSKYFEVPQNRERYFIVATLAGKGAFAFPEEQHEYVPKLSSVLDKEVDEKYYISDEKAQKIIIQALEKLEHLGKVHSTVTPAREKRRQMGPRAKENEKEMFTLTAQDIHGIIIQERSGIRRDAFNYISNKLLEFVEKKGYIPKFFNPYNCSDCGELAPTATTACGGLTTSATVLVFTDKNSGEPVTVQWSENEMEDSFCNTQEKFNSVSSQRNILKNQESSELERTVCAESDFLNGIGAVVTDYATNLDHLTDVAGCIMARDYKGFGRQQMNAVIVEKGEKVNKKYLECVVNDRGFVNKPAQVTDIAPTLRAQDHGNQPKVIETNSEDAVMIIDDTYGFESGVRVYKDTCPTVRASRQGLKVLEESEQPEIKVIGTLENSGTTQQHNNRVHDTEGISPTLTAVSGGTHHIKIFDTSRFGVRKLTPTEYGRLQGFPMDNGWEQVVSDSQAYKQFGNAVSVPVVTAIGYAIKDYLDSLKKCNHFFSLRKKYEK